jgi:hypothetical protein
VLRAHTIVLVRVCVCIVINTSTITPSFTVIMAPQRKSSMLLVLLGLSKAVMSFPLVRR